MKKKVFGRKFSRDRGSRKALFRSLIRALVLHGKIKTTLAKAKAVQAEIEKLVNRAKRSDISARRQIYASFANDRKITDLLFTKITPQFSGRSGGYTRIVRLPLRRGDRAKVARLEWSQEISLSEQSKSKKTKSKTKKVKEKAKLTESESKSVKQSLRSLITKSNKAKSKK